MLRKNLKIKAFKNNKHKHHVFIEKKLKEHFKICFYNYFLYCHFDIFSDRLSAMTVMH